MQSKKPLDFWLRKASLLLFFVLIVATTGYHKHFPVEWMPYWVIFMIIGSAGAAVIAIVDLIDTLKSDHSPFQLYKKLATIRAQMRTGMPEGDSVVLRVTDRSRRTDEWRCFVHLMTRKRETMVGLPLFMISVPFMLIFLIDQLPGYISPEAMCEIFRAVFFAWILLLAFLLQSLMLKFYPTPDSVRITTATLTRMGIYKVTPQRSVFLPWSLIDAVTADEGDVYFGSIGLGVITRNAFATVGEADAFVQRAMALKADAAFFAVPGAWPPPPRLDHDT